MTPVLASHFADYAAFHQTPGNRECHMVGIPLIVFTLIAMLARVPLFALGGFTVTLAELLIVAVTAYYLTMDKALALVMLAASAAFAAAGRFMPFSASLALFVLGWVLQFVGHYVYEKKSPAFFRNFTHLLVGPLWILAKVSGRA
jgi:uncharacterized membrane protein YGL010W